MSLLIKFWINCLIHKETISLLVRRAWLSVKYNPGKTANYTGLVCKAADAGFNLIIVLAGIHNNLRSQTQTRLDEGF